MTLIDDVSYVLQGDVDNFRIIRGALSERIRIDPGLGDRAVSGLLVTDPSSTRLLIVENVSILYSINFLEESLLSDEQNRLNEAVTLGPEQNLILFYEPADQRWRPITGGSGGGGLHAPTHIKDGGDEIDGDQLDIDWNPTNYTPAAVPAEVTDVDHLTSHLYGIDFLFGDIINSIANLDHGSLLGLSDDDHTQYARLAGRIGGQILYGGTAASEDLRLVSTLNATKGDIFIGLFTWPVADGSSGHVLSTNGSGVLSFIDPGTFVVGDHGALTGLSDDDHTQYARLGGRAGSQTLYGGTAAGEDLHLFSTLHATKGDITIGLFTWPVADGSSGYVLSTNGSGVLSFVDPGTFVVGDHGTLTGLGDDDHTQYALLLGRAGGQVLYGGTAANDDLRLTSTFHATKGDIFIGPLTWPTADGTSGYVLATNGSGQLSFIDPGTFVVGDHGTLSGLADDDHAQYALLAGRAGSQTLYGGTAAGEDLRLFSTAHGTKGDIQIGLLLWPTADASANSVMVTNGSGQLSLVSLSSLFDHGTLGGLSDDDHAQYMLAESSVVDNTLVRWDGTTGRAVQESSVVLSDAEAMSGLLSAAASSFFSAGGTVATAGNFRGDSTLTIQARNVANSADVPLVSWASDDVTFGHTSVDSVLNGTTVTIKGLRWPAADGAANAVMTTNGSGILSLVSVTSLFDHGTLGGLSDDDHAQYVLAEPSSVDNTLVRWDSTTGRAIQVSGVTLSDGDAITGLVSAAASSFYSVGGTPATAGSFRGNASFTLQARNAGNSSNVSLVTWASDDVTFGTTGFDTHVVGTAISIRSILWPLADGSSNQVMITNGSGQLSFASVTSLFDHGTLGGLADDDHTQYVLAEPSSNDNRLVRWDSTSGRAIQESGVTLSDGDALTGLSSAAASSFYSIGTTPSTAGNIRGNATFTLQARNAGNTSNIPLVSWASDDVTFGNAGVDAIINGTSITLDGIKWPTSDGSPDAVMVTDGAGQLSLVAVTSLFDHGTLGGLADDDHAQYVLAEPSSNDNRLVRWDSTTGRAIQESGVTLSDAEAMSGLSSVAASSFYSVGATPASTGAIRGNSSFTVKARNVANSVDAGIITWAADDVEFGDAGFTTTLNGDFVFIRSHRWPTADGSASTVLTTNGSGILSFSAVDHGTLAGLSDDDHSQYILAEPSSVDNRVVRWDSTTGRAVQTSAVTIDDSGNISTSGGNLDLGGGDILNVDDMTLSSTSPSLNFIDTDATANGGYWRISTNSTDDLVFATLNDAMAGLENALVFRRTGAALDKIEMTSAYVETNRTDVIGVATDNFAATTNNYAIGSTVTHLRLTSTGDESFTGIAGGTQGRIVYVTNTDSLDIITFRHESSTSTAANRFITPDAQDFPLNPGATVVLFYDGTSNRWRLLLKEGATRMQWRGVIQTTTASAAQFFSLTMPSYYTYYVNVWVSSLDGTGESTYCSVHREYLYTRHETADATLVDTLELTSYQVPAQVETVATNTATAITLLVDPAAARNWRHNWFVEVVAVPMDDFV